MRTTKVILGEQTYIIEELRSRDNAKWRALLEGHFDVLAGLLEGVPGMDITDGQSLAGLVRGVGGTLIQSVDLLYTLVIAYAPQLEQPLEDAYDSEMLDVFVKILGLAYPFGSVLETLGTLTTGSA